MSVYGTFRRFRTSLLRRLLVRLWSESSQYKKVTGTVRSEHKLSMHLYYMIFKCNWRYGDNQYNNLLILSVKLERKKAAYRRVQYATLLLGHINNL
jgi:hypothetical protein